MSALSDALKNAGVKLGPFQQAGTDVALTWDPAVTGPILDDRVIVVFPDFHLASGGAGDIFRGSDGGGLGRLLPLLKALLGVAPQFPKLTVVHLGDLYDVWRAYPDFSTHPTSDYDVIEKPYGDALGLLVEQLNARVCIGNHDGGLGLFPPAWARNDDGSVNGQLAYGHLLSNSRVLAFHGHQEDTIDRALGGSQGSDAVRLATEVARLSNPLSLGIQQGISLVIDMFSDDTFSLTDLLGSRWPEADPPADAHGFRSPRWCDRTGRATLQRLVGALPGASGLRLVFVGHSHRPGVSSVHVNGRLVPLIDVGSWALGSSQFAIVTEGEVRLWHIVG